VKPTLIILALLIAAGLVAGIVAPPSRAEVAPPLTNSRYEAVTRIDVGALAPSEAARAAASDGTPIPLIDVLGAGVLLGTMGLATTILVTSRASRASRRRPDLVRAGR